jgi:hypothetical protein
MFKFFRVEFSGGVYVSGYYQTKFEGQRLSDASVVKLFALKLVAISHN